MRAALAPNRIAAVARWFGGGVISGLVWAMGLSAATPSLEIGRPAYRDFAPGQTGIGYLNQIVTQDRAGFVYLGSFRVIRYTEGTRWKMIDTTPESVGLRKFVRAADGTIYGAGVGIIGFLRGSGDASVFISLADKLPPTELRYDDIRDVAAAGAAVYFVDEEKILRWRDGVFKVIPYRSPSHSRGVRLHGVGEATYVKVPGRPLGRVTDAGVEELADDPALREEMIVLIEPRPDGGLTLLTAGRGFFQLKDGRVTPQPSGLDRWLSGRKLWRALRLADGGLAVLFDAVSGEGGLRFDADGRYAGPLDQTLGLYTKQFRDLFQDHEGGLWLGSEIGAFRLEWPSPLSIFDAVNGLGAGAVAAVARHEGVLYAATEEGVFRLVPADAQGRAARFERVLREPVSALLSHPSGLLALGYAQLWQQTPGGFTAVAEAKEGGGLRQSERSPDEVWVGTAQGVQALRLTVEGWRAYGQPVAPAKKEPVDMLAECAAEAGGRWVARADGVAWETGDGHAPKKVAQLVNVSAGVVASLLEERDAAGAVLWIGGTKGLVRLEVAGAFPRTVPFALQLQGVGVREGERLEPEHDPLRFDYVAPRHQIGDSVTYRTRLVGLEKNWSAWTKERTRSFVRLPAGAYRFEVNARDADGVESAPAAWAFAVLPPWWWAWWAIAGYAISAGVLVGGIVWVRTRALRRHAAQLEKIVEERTRQLAERTAELAQQNTELVRLNKLELDEKTAAKLGEEKARLEMLRYQLNPHFLFNTLTSISGTLGAEKSTARAMVERLTDFCRLTLHRGNDRDWTTLGEDMKLLRAYLDIEQSRWGDLLDVTIDCPDELAGAQLPHFLLLPLVENALKYGHATSVDRVGIRLAARREADGTLVIEVSNTGEWVEPGTGKGVNSLGIGLENLRERLRRYYPRRHELSVFPGDGWVTVRLQIKSADSS